MSWFKLSGPFFRSPVNLCLFYTFSGPVPPSLSPLIIPLSDFHCLGAFFSAFTLTEPLLLQRKGEPRSLFAPSLVDPEPCLFQVAEASLCAAVFP